MEPPMPVEHCSRVAYVSYGLPATHPPLRGSSSCSSGVPPTVMARTASRRRPWRQLWSPLFGLQCRAGDAVRPLFHAQRPDATDLPLAPKTRLGVVHCHRSGQVRSASRSFSRACPQPLDHASHVSQELLHALPCQCPRCFCWLFFRPLIER